MKIVVIGPVYPFRGGIAHHNSSLISALRAQGHDVLALSYKRQYPRFLYPGRSDKDPSSQYIELDSVEFIIDSINPLSWIQTINRITNFSPEKIIIHWWTSFWSPFYFYLLSMINKKNFKAVAIIHNVYSHESSWFDKYITKQILKKFERYIVQSDNEFIKLSNLFPDRIISKYPHPIYNTMFSKSMEKYEARRKFGLRVETKLILMFGIIRKYKGLDVLLSALDYLVHALNIKNIKLIVAGEFWDPIKKYEKIVEEYNLTDYIEFHNRYIPNEEIESYFLASDIFVAPYLSGTQSGALNLALAWGVRSIVSSSILDRNIEQSGLIHEFENGNFKELALLINNLLEDTSKKTNSYLEYSWKDFAQVCIS